MKHIKSLSMLLFALTVQIAWACPVCDLQQPKITRGWTHGAGPQSNWDWLIIAVMVVITLLTFVFSLKYLIKPGEANANHIKQAILNN